MLASIAFWVFALAVCRLFSLSSLSGRRTLPAAPLRQQIIDAFVPVRSVSAGLYHRPEAVQAFAPVASRLQSKHLWLTTTIDHSNESNHVSGTQRNTQIRRGEREDSASSRIFIFHLRWNSTVCIEGDLEWHSRFEESLLRCTPLYTASNTTLKEKRRYSPCHHRALHSSRL